MQPKKPSKCRICKAPFQKRSMSHIACSIACSAEWAKRKREKSVEAEARQARKEIRERKEKIKTRSDWIKECQVAFNSFVRARDSGKSCICCGRPLNAQQVGGGFDAGHYRSVGSAPHLRFDERNCHGQTKQCNRYGAGRVVDYRIGLIERIGLEAVEALESDQVPRKFTIDELKAIKAEYREKLADLRKGKS